MVKCLPLRKASGPGLEKQQSGNSACTKILTVEVGWEIKVQESQMSVNSSQTVVRGKPLFSTIYSVQLCVFGLLIIR